MNAEGVAPLTDGTGRRDPGEAADPRPANPGPDGTEGAAAETAVVTMRFDAADPDALLAALSKYVVLARGVPGCRNVDLCASFTKPSRFVVLEKWDSTERARSHFDSELMVEMAEACRGVLESPPDIDLLEGLSAHDLA